MKRGNHQATAREAKMPSVRIYKAQPVQFTTEAQMKVFLHTKAELFYTYSENLTLVLKLSSKSKHL